MLLDLGQIHGPSYAVHRSLCQLGYVDRQYKNLSYAYSVIMLPAYPASFAHNFVSWMQSFLFHRVPGCSSIADLSLKIVFWTQRFAVGLVDMENSESQDS